MVKYSDFDKWLNNHIKRGGYSVKDGIHIETNDGIIYKLGTDEYFVWFREMFNKFNKEK